MTIRIDGKENYKWINGIYPRGEGNWLFQIADEQKVFRGTYSEACQKAKAYAKKNHPRVYSIKIMP